MFSLLINVLLLVYFAQGSLAQSTTGCTIDDVDVLSIPEGDSFIFNESVYDNIDSTYINYPIGRPFSPGENVTKVSIERTTYVTSGFYTNYLLVYRIDEANELSLSGERFYNFTLLVTCNEVINRVPTLIPIHETNTFTPTFQKETYEYYLYSSLYEDLERLLELNPITVNDNDMSNVEVLFSIQANDYFDIIYGDVVPGSLNKNHTAKLIPKKTPIILTQTLELTIYVTDVGYPAKSSNATLIFTPVGTKVPTFKEAFSIGDYYSNGTFIMRSQPELENIPKTYRITADLQGTLYTEYFEAVFDENFNIKVTKQYNLPELAIYKYSYLIYTLTVTYTDINSNNFITKGNTTVLVEFHTDS